MTPQYVVKDRDGRVVYEGDSFEEASRTQGDPVQPRSPVAAGRSPWATTKGTVPYGPRAASPGIAGELSGDALTHVARVIGFARRVNEGREEA